MTIHIITLFPELFAGAFEHSIIKRAIHKEKVQLHLHQLREYSTHKHKKVDDYPFGGEAGLVMTIEPILKCIENIQAGYSTKIPVIYLTPDGEVYKQSIANEFSMYENMILLCGHYKGIDERIREHIVDREISIGDYVLSGGELAAMVLVDSIVRIIPGVLNDETSALTDSFQNGLLSHPVYTRPAEYNGWKVPPVLLSGNFAAIENWKQEQAISRTKLRRPDIL